MAGDGGMTGKQFQEREGTEDWRVLGWGVSAWFSAPSHAAGAVLVRRVVESGAGLGIVPDVDLRDSGVHVRIHVAELGSLTDRDVALAAQVSGVARELGLVADPTAVQHVNLTLDALDASAVMSFWATALGYDVDGEDVIDPRRLHPGIWFQDMDAPRPLRNRIHLDAGTPYDLAAARVAAVVGDGGTIVRSGMWRTLADPEGNEVDVFPLTPGDDLSGLAGAEDWRAMLSAMVRYRVRPGTEEPSGSDAALALAEAAARVADEAGVALLISLRPDAVTISTGKDRWTVPAYTPVFPQVQAAARELGLIADPAGVLDLQIAIDAVDLPAVRNFWAATLGYRPLTDVVPGGAPYDLYDPRGLNPPIMLQPADPSETERLAQRNRIHVDVYVPDDQAAARIAAAVAAGGRIVYDAEAPEWWTLADPEGNEVDVAVVPGREEIWLAAQGTGRQDAEKEEATHD
ncbi:VOC family protein [Promicromonospora sp. NPDC057138]|uniref:VOC family protein n=1 Tax=Promicromonospora sp. NPDC057138 TaxID=3346031 RepID=UPI00362EA79C